MRPVGAEIINQLSIITFAFLEVIFLKVYNSEYFDLRFFVSQFAGYGLHEKCLVTLEQFRKLLVEAK